jgi:hypothetical protein
LYVHAARAARAPLTPRRAAPGRTPAQPDGDAPLVPLHVRPAVDGADGHAGGAGGAGGYVWVSRRNVLRRRDGAGKDGVGGAAQSGSRRLGSLDLRVSGWVRWSGACGRGQRVWMKLRSGSCEMRRRVDFHVVVVIHS